MLIGGEGVVVNVFFISGNGVIDELMKGLLMMR